MPLVRRMSGSTPGRRIAERDARHALDIEHRDDTALHDSCELARASRARG